MRKIYNGLELCFNNWTKEETSFWHDKADQYTPVWTLRTIENGVITHYSSHVSDRQSLGKFKHILTTGNPDFEFRVYEKGILRVLKKETQKRIEKELFLEYGKLYPVKHH